MSAHPPSSYRYSAHKHSFPHHESSSWWALDSSATVYSVLSLLTFYYLLAYLNLLPFTISGALWNSIVFLTPSRLISALDRQRTMQSIGGLGSGSFGYSDFRAKSDAVQRVLGSDRNSLLSAFTGRASTTLSSKASLPPGLGNWDNSCYQNSVIQGLASLSSLGRFLDHNIETLGGRHIFATHQALKDIVNRLNSSKNAGRKLWIPPELKSMSSWQQQDAQEYFSKVIDQLDKEIREASKGLTDDFGLKMVPSQAEDTKKERLPTSLTHEKVTEILGKLQVNAGSLPSPANPLEGLLAQRVGCMRCGWTEGLSLFQFNCLTVTVGSKWVYDIRECLEEYTALEPIEGVECAKCTLLRTEGQLLNILKQLEARPANVEDSPGTLTPETVKRSAEERLEAVQKALREDDFSESTLSETCRISKQNRVCSTKSRQAVIARAPKSLVLHVNRSVFDELTGSLRKNHADVRFPRILDLGEWCLGTSAREEGAGLESWIVDPSRSMLRHPESPSEGFNDRLYELRAVIAHYGRHENGHYICYRKHSLESFPAQIPKFATDDDNDDEDQEPFEHWFRLSDEDVSLASESTVLGQGGAFMLFYELLDDEPPSLQPSVGTPVNEKEEILANSEAAVDAPSSASSNLTPKPVIIGGIPSAEDISQQPNSAPKSDVSDMSTSSGWSEETAPDTNSSVLSPPLIMRTSSTTPVGADNAENPERVPSPMITAN